MITTDMQTPVRRRRGAISFWIATCALATLVAAVPMHADDAQPAARAVHLSYIEGQVRITQGDQVITEGATVNMPLFEGMQVSTSQDGRAEIEFEDGSVARLSPNTTVTLSVLRGDGVSGNAEMLLNGGLAYFELQAGSQPGQMSVRFGDSSVTPSGNAVIRVRMDTPPGDLAVLSGNVNLNRSNGAMQLAMHGGESVTLYANDVSRYDLNESVDPDSWDAWNTDRDQSLETLESASTDAPPSQIGPESGSPDWSNLDANGSWYNVPGQGYMWSPFAASNPGYDPYGCGQWMWYPRYGYMFVPCDNFGFLTSSCGSWGYYDSFGWGWSPGAGGCNPWWNGLGYYPGPVYGGGGLPLGYRGPHRPIGPHSPPSPGHPVPVIVVRGSPMPPVHSPLPPRDRNQPITIAGNTLMPVRPVVSRGGDGHAPTGAPRIGYSVFDGSSRTSSSTNSLTDPSTGPAFGRPVYTSPHPGVSSSPAGRSGSSGYSAGASHSTTSSAPTHSGYGGGGSSYHPSGGGGGGGSYHASSGGGGGGGGGASHASSGGGGGGGAVGGGGAHK
jgi:hypothetical protein